MEEAKKRAREDSDIEGGGVDSARSEADLTEPKRPRVDPEDSSSNESRLIQETILEILDGPDMDTAVQGLDSVIRSFEEEIIATGRWPGLGYLLEASDDELGLPPTSASDKKQGLAGEALLAGSDGFKLGETLWFENEVGGYGLYEPGTGADGFLSGYSDGDGEFMAVGGLFDYEDAGGGRAEV